MLLTSFYKVCRGKSEHGEIFKTNTNELRMSYSLNSLKGAYIGNYIREYSGAYSGNTRSLDHSSYERKHLHIQEANPGILTRLMHHDTVMKTGA